MIDKDSIMNPHQGSTAAPKRKKPFRIVFGIVLALLLIAAGAFYYQHKQHARAERIAELVKQGDERFDNREFAMALEYYKQASQLDGRADIIEKVVESTDAAEKAKAAVSDYDNAVRQADSTSSVATLEKLKDAINAIDADYLPADKTPADAMSRIDGKIAQVRQQIQDALNAAVSVDGATAVAWPLNRLIVHVTITNTFKNGMVVSPLNFTISNDSGQVKRYIPIDDDLEVLTLSEGQQIGGNIAFPFFEGFNTLNVDFPLIGKVSVPFTYTQY